MYALTMSSTVKPVEIVSVLIKQLPHWKSFTERYLRSNFNRFEVSADDLLQDVWISFNTKANQANPKAFAYTEEEAECILASTIMLYAKNAKYIDGLAELSKAKNQTGSEDMVFCGMESVAETLATPEENATIGIDAVYARQFLTKWDKMCDDGELTSAQKLDIIKQLAPIYASSSTEDRAKLVDTIRQLIDLGPDTPDEYKEALYDLMRV